MSSPTVIPGVQRSHIEANASDLRKLIPGSAPDVVNRAIGLLGSVAFEGVTDRTAVLWGHQLQQTYSDLVAATLGLSQDDVLARVTGYVNRMVEVLASIDLQAVVSSPMGNPGLGQYLKKLNSRVDTPEELEAARVELDQLVKLMGNTLEPLLTLKERLQAQSRRIDDVGLDVEAAALAANYLSGKFSEKRPDLAARLLERSMSLTQTVAQIRSSASLRGAQTDHPLTLISSIQNVALVTVPGWLSTLAALTGTLRGSQRPTHTEVGEIDYRLRSILQQLKH